MNRYMFQVAVREPGRYPDWYPRAGVSLVDVVVAADSVSQARGLVERVVSTEFDSRYEVTIPVLPRKIEV